MFLGMHFTLLTSHLVLQIAYIEVTMIRKDSVLPL